MEPPPGTPPPGVIATSTECPTLRPVARSSAITPARIALSRVLQRRLGAPVVVRAGHDRAGLAADRDVEAVAGARPSRLAARRGRIDAEWTPAADRWLSKTF